jgi:opacity protein-like surface antigen
MRNFLAAAALAAAFSAPASAAVVDFTNIKGEWFDVVSLEGPAPTITGSGTANASIRWGSDTGLGQSGYDFVALAIPSLSVSPPGGSATTSIATFRHINQPIGGGTSIASVKLKFTTDVLVDSNPFGTVTFIYSFSHDETPNAADPCAYGGANNQGVNINGCADRVQANFNSQSDFFTIDGYDYALDVVGFLVGGNPATSFLTTERLDNEAELRGRLVLYSEAGVPEPATWAMMIARFGLVGAAVRRRHPQATRAIA